MSDKLDALFEKFKSFDAKELIPQAEKIPLYYPRELLEAPLPNLDVGPILEHLEYTMMGKEEDVNAHRRRLDFLKNYGAGTADVPLPLTIRLVYDDFASWDFQSSDARHFVMDLMGASRRILEVFEITEKPEQIELHVWRPPFRHPRDESRIHPPERDPRNGSWITVMSLNVQEETPFFSFDELDLAHRELWGWMREYARRSMNPCGELPLGETKIGRYLPKQ